MKVESNIQIGQLVKIKDEQLLNPDALYVVVSKLGSLCELFPASNKAIKIRGRYWTEKGLSVYA